MLTLVEASGVLRVPSVAGCRVGGGLVCAQGPLSCLLSVGKTLCFGPAFLFPRRKTK